jgi:hypothetical protein
VAGKSYSRRAGRFWLGIEATERRGLPFGRYPRLLLAWAATEAVRKRGRRLEIGRSLTAFLRRLGIASSGGRRHAHRIGSDVRVAFGGARLGVAEDLADEEQAREVLVDVIKGSDPLEERQKEEKRGTTLAQLSERYLRDYAKPHYKPQTLRESRGAWSRYLEKPLRGRCLPDVTRNEVAQLQASLYAESGPYAGNDAIRLLRRLLAQAIQWGLLPQGHNRAKGLKAYKEDSRERYLSDDDHRRLHQALADYEAEGGPAKPGRAAFTKGGYDSSGGRSGPAGRVPSGRRRTRDRSGLMAPVRSARKRSVSVRLAPVRTARLRSAPMSLALVRLISERRAPVRRAEKR